MNFRFVGDGKRRVNRHKYMVEVDIGKVFDNHPKKHERLIKCNRSEFYSHLFEYYGTFVAVLCIVSLKTN